MAEEDLIYGKNRHMFGGIEPSNMIEFSSRVNDAGKVEIIAAPPNDTIIDGQTVCSVAGAIIRRKYGNYPENEFDGEFVNDITEKITFTDVDANSNRIIYYSAFPYSIQGVYNRNHYNRTIVNEIDTNVYIVGFCRYETDTKRLYSELEINFDTATISNVMIRRSSTGYPVDENDGDLVKSIQSPEIVKDYDVVDGVIYYYSAFVYNEYGDYGRNENNRTRVYVRSYWCFGFNLDKTVSDPASKISYPEDVDNVKYNPVIRTVASTKLDLRDWNIVPGYYFMPRPCIIRKDGTFVTYLNPSDYNYTVAGSPSNIVDENFKDLVMLEWPLLYISRTKEGNIYKFRISNIKLNDDYDCWCNYDINNSIVDNFYMAAYPCKFDTSSNPVCKSGVTGPFSAKTSTIKTKISAIGDGWSSETFAEASLIIDLLLMMAKNTNINSIFGAGETTDSSKDSTVVTGTYDTVGLFSDNGNKAFGIQGLWGAHAKTAGSLIDGLYCNLRYNTKNNYISNLYYKITPGTHDGSTAKGFTNSGYLTPSVTNITGNYIKEMDVYPGGRLPSIMEGSSSTYECAWFDSDGYYYSSDGSNSPMYTVGFNIGAGNCGNDTPASFYAIDRTDTSNPFDGETVFRLSYRLAKK